MGEGVCGFSTTCDNIAVWVVVLRKGQASSGDENEQTRNPPSTRKQENVRPFPRARLRAAWGMAGSCKILPFRPGARPLRTGGRGKGPPNLAQRHGAEYNPPSGGRLTFRSPLSTSSCLIGKGKHCSLDSSVHGAEASFRALRDYIQDIGKKPLLEMAQRVNYLHTPSKRFLRCSFLDESLGRAGTARAGKT